MSFSISEMFGYLSGFLGLLLSLICLIFMKGKSSVRISLFAALVVMSLTAILGALNYSGKLQYFPHLIRVDSPIHFLVGPVMYFYTLSSVKKDFKFRLIHLVNFIPFLINLLHFMPLYISDTVNKLNYYGGYLAHGTMIMQRYYLIKTIFVCGYFLAQVVLYIQFIKAKDNTKGGERNLIIWVGIFLSLQLLSYSGFAFDHITGLETFSDPYKFSMNMVSFLLLSVATALLFFPKLLYGDISPSNNKPKYIHSGISESEKIKIYTKWLQYINQEDKPFLNPKLTLNEAAKKTGTAHQRLSQVINEKAGMNFNDYINSLRIKEAKQLMRSDTYKKLTIDAIAMKSGFNSKSPFYAAFKKFTGIAPKMYIKSLKEPLHDS